MVQLIIHLVRRSGVACHFVIASDCGISEFMVRQLCKSICNQNADTKRSNPDGSNKTKRSNLSIVGLYYQIRRIRDLKIIQAGIILISDRP